MKGRIAVVVVALAVLVSCFIGTGIAERPEGAAVMRLKRQIDGNWNIVNRSHIGVYNGTVGEVTFYSDGTEIEVISGIFAAASMIHIDTNIGSDRCFGIQEITLYTDEVGFIEWDSCDPLGNFRRIRKNPVRIILLNNDEIVIIGMGGDGRALSVLTRQ